MTSETKRIRLGTGVVVLPLDHPLQIAEDYAFLDPLCWTRLGGLDHRKVLRSMELMRDEVIPGLRDSEPPPPAARAASSRHAAGLRGMRTLRPARSSIRAAT